MHYKFINQFGNAVMKPVLNRSYLTSKKCFVCQVLEVMSPEMKNRFEKLKKVNIVTSFSTKEKVTNESNRSNSTKKHAFLNQSTPFVTHEAEVEIMEVESNDLAKVNMQHLFLVRVNPKSGIPTILDSFC
jgi:hypothetical protein